MAAPLRRLLHTAAAARGLASPHPRLTLSFTGRHAVAVVSRADEVLLDLPTSALAAKPARDGPKDGKKAAALPRGRTADGTALLAAELGQQLAAKGITTVDWDRRDHKYTGKVKSFLDALQKSGVQVKTYVDPYQ